MNTSKELLKLAKEVLAAKDPMDRLEAKIQKLKDQYGDDKELLKLKLFGLALKLFPSSPLQKRVDEELKKL